MKRFSVMRLSDFSVTISWMFILLLLTGCHKSDYEVLVEKELSKGIVNKELIFDMEIGQTKKQFYDRCWQMNKEKKISQGPGNNYAKYEFDLESSDGTAIPTDMLFYGIFDPDDIMIGMDMIYSYQAWAPWNQDLQADKLIKSLERKLLTDFPGNDFIEIDMKIDSLAPKVKVDGNRQILMYPKSEKDVAVKIEDLRFKIK